MGQTYKQSYYDVPSYDAASRERLLQLSETTHEVVIVGAGPIGLYTALRLAQLGVKTIILERSDSASQGSRALALSERSLELLRQVDGLDRIMDDGISWGSGRSFSGFTEVSRFGAIPKPEDGLPPYVSLQQSIIEHHLIEKALADPKIEILWETEYVGSSQYNDRVDIELSSSEERYVFGAKWVVACDGARSSVRSDLGLRLEGKTFSSEFVIADIRVDLPLPTERYCWFNPSALPGGTILLHKQPFGVWRFDYQVPADFEGEPTDEDVVRPIVGHHLKDQFGIEDWEFEWITTYKAHSRSLTKYNHGRILFAGDAAHLLPIFGVRGMNSGLMDAENLAWRLSSLVAGASSEEILDSYSEEQINMFHQNKSFADRSAAFMAPARAATRNLRDAILDLAEEDEKYSKVIDPRYVRTMSYTAGDFIFHENEGPFTPGSLLPDLSTRKNQLVRVEEELGDVMTLVATEEFAANVGELEGVDLLTVEQGSELADQLLEAQVPALLIRPDRYIYSILDDQSDLAIHLNNIGWATTLERGDVNA